jgi:hypothetical protein
MTPNSAEIARRDAGNVIVRPTGIRARWELNDLSTSDGQSVRAVFSAAVRPLEGSADRKMLEETFLGASVSVSAAEVTEHFRASLQSAAALSAGATDLPTLMTDAGRSAFTSKLAETARAVAFNCGLDLLPPFELSLDSPTLRQQQEIARRAAAQEQRLSRASTLFKQFEELRRTAPELPADQIFQRIAGADPSDQAESLRLLLMTSARSSASTNLWIVAGPHLLKIESNSETNPRPEIFTPPPLLGPLRSVNRAEFDGKSVLLIGARSGVLIVDPLKPNEAIAYADPAVTSSLGFNAVALANGKIWASHTEAGLVAWDLNQRDQPTVAVRPAGFAARNLYSLDGNRLVFTSENKLFELFPDGAFNPTEAGAPGAILTIIPESPASLLLIHEDGECCRRDRATLKITHRAKLSGRITAAAALPWLGSTRLLLAPETGCLNCIGLDDDLVTQYQSPHTGLRLAAAAPDRVAAVSADRQRLVLWSTWDGRAPAAEIHVASLARHRIADVEFS